MLQLHWTSRWVGSHSFGGTQNEGKAERIQHQRATAAVTTKSEYPLEKNWQNYRGNLSPVGGVGEVGGSAEGAAGSGWRSRRRRRATQKTRFKPHENVTECGVGRQRNYGKLVI